MFVRIIYGLRNGAFNYSEFLCDTEDDLENLPTNIAEGYADGKKIPTCAIGSVANVIEGGKVYILSNENEWTYWTTRGGGGDTPSGRTITELIYDGNNITKDGVVQTFEDLIYLLKVSDSFTYLLYNNRAYLATMMQNDVGSMRYICFQSTLIDGLKSKCSEIQVNSNDGIEIAGIQESSIINENSANRVSAITDSNKSNTNYYTSTKAVVDYISGKFVTLTQAEYDALSDAAKAKDVYYFIKEV